ncbi:MAG: hypothetical protein ACE5OZ_13005 [Candidatus Heimdallarchaeota archaeon]
MEAQEITPSMILLFIGGVVTIFVQLPLIDQILPIIDGGITLQNGYGDYASDYVDGWTLLGLPGILWWILLILGGLLCLIPASHKFQPFIPEMDTPFPGGLPLLLAIVGSLIQITVVLLIFLGDADDITAFGLGMLDMPSGMEIGFGFWVMLIAAIISVVGAILLYLEEAAA